MDERWQRLFADLEAHGAAPPDEEEIAALVEAERVAITLDDRLAGSLGAKVRAIMSDEAGWSGVLQFVGSGWILLGDDRRDLIVNLAQLGSIGPLGAPRPAAERRPSLTSALRRIVGASADVYCHSRFSGVIQFVGADHLDTLDSRGNLSSIRLAELTIAAIPRGILSAT